MFAGQFIVGLTCFAQEAAESATAESESASDSSTTEVATKPAKRKAQKVSQSRKIEPELTYRTAAFTRRFRSVYFKPGTDSDYVDQLYLTFTMSRQYDYRHDVVIEPSVRTHRQRPKQALETVIEQGYVRIQASDTVVVTAGKKTEYDGSGFMVNPSDLLNETKDLFDTLYQREGKFFTRVVKRFGNHSLGVGYIPARGKELSYGRAWVTASSDLFDTDIRLQFTNQRRELNTVGASAARFFGDHVELHFDGRYQQRQRHEGDELAPDSPEANSSYGFEDASGYYLAGSRLVLTPRRTIVLEGIQNQSGLLPSDFENFYNEKRKKDDPGDPESRLIGRHYGFISYQDDDSIKAVHLGLSHLVNINDQSSFSVAQARYYLSPITSVEWTYTAFTGNVNTEFGEMPFAGTAYLIFRGRF